MTELWMISAVSLAVVLAACFAATFCPRRYYDDNFLQRAGLAGIAFGAGTRLSLLVERHSLDGAGYQPMFQVDNQHHAKVCQHQQANPITQLWRGVQPEHHRYDRRSYQYNVGTPGPGLFTLAAGLDQQII